MEDLKKLAGQIQSKKLRKIVFDALNDPDNVLIEKFGDELNFESSPASKKVHQSYPGGLIEHTLAVTELALSMSEVFEKIYGANINRDILISGGILHDFYKYLTYKEENNKYERSRIGSKIDHLTLTVSEFYQRDIPIELLHVLVAHHGKGGPTPPRSLEALIVHLADVCDSEFMNETLLGAQAISQNAGIKVKDWNSKKAINICKIMTDKGIDEVKEYLKKNRE